MVSAVFFGDNHRPVADGNVDAGGLGTDDQAGEGLVDLIAELIGRARPSKQAPRGSRMMAVRAAAVRDLMVVTFPNSGDGH